MSAPSYPIRPLTLRAENFRGLGGVHELRLERGLTLLIGKNGSGKSSLLNAIEWCLFGAQATNKSKSGIDERGEWALAHHGATGEVRVTLELELEEGTARLTRTRPVDAKARDDDQIELVLPGDQVLQAGELPDWLEFNGMPDWNTWKRSFCQHQEQSRARVTEAADRSEVIAVMLGLGAYRQLTGTLKTLKHSKLQKCASTTLGELAEDRQRALERPAAELLGIEAQLEQRGVSAAQAGEAQYVEQRSGLLGAAARIAEQLELQATALPPQGTTEKELLQWARSWPRELRGKLEPLGNQRTELSRRVSALQASQQALEPARRAEADAKQLHERLLDQHGSLVTLREQRAALDEERTGLEAERRRIDASGQLLRDALSSVKASDEPAHCPVCEQQRGDLVQLLEDKLAMQAGVPLQEEFERLEARSSALEGQRHELEGAARELKSSGDQVDQLQRKLRGLLPEGCDENTSVDQLLSGWIRQERELGEALGRVDDHLLRHGEQLDLLDLLLSHRAAQARANESAGELSETPEFEELQRVIDDAAGLASDLDAIGAMARDLEDVQSKQQVESVNRSIDGYFNTITGDSRQGRVQVKPKQTATKVTYQLLNELGQNITGTLNQAAFNALSLAALFASAETRAHEDRPQFLLLDDPGQSLDQEHQVGLARAICDLAEHTPLIVGSFPGPLAETLAESGPPRSCTYHLTRTDDHTTRIQEASE